MAHRPPFRWLILVANLLVTSQAALAQAALLNGQNATLRRVAAKQRSELDSIARLTHGKPALMRIDRINPAVPHSSLFIVTSAVGIVEELPALASGGGLLALVETLEKQLASASIGRGKAHPETSVYATVTLTSVYATLTISADGKVQQAKIVEGQNTTVNAAVLAAIQHLPRLTPGQVAGTAVPVKLTIPVQVRS